MIGKWWVRWENMDSEATFFVSNRFNNFWNDTFLAKVIFICPDRAWEISWGPTCCLRKLVQSPVLLKKQPWVKGSLPMTGLLGMDESIYAFLDQARWKYRMTTSSFIWILAYINCHEKLRFKRVLDELFTAKSMQKASSIHVQEVHLQTTWSCNPPGTNISHLGKRNIIFKSTFGRWYVSSKEGINNKPTQKPWKMDQNNTWAPIWRFCL